MPHLPKAYQHFKSEFPNVWSAYDQLGAAVHSAGPLDENTRALLKLALAVGAQMEGATHAHTARARELGISDQAIRQVVLLAAPTLGFPRMMAAMTWVDDILNAEQK